MPKVPVAERQVARGVIQTPNTTVRAASAEAFGAGQEKIVQAASGLVNNVAGIFEDNKKKADELKVQGAITDAIKRKNEMLHDPKTGYYNQRGLGAAETLDKYKEGYGVSMQQIEDNLANEEQKSAFKKWRLRQDAELDGQMQRHTFQEINKYDDEQTAATIDTLSESAIVNYKEIGLPDKDGMARSKLSENISDMEEAIRRHGRRRGLPKEAIDKRVLEAKSKTHMGVVNRMLANDEDLYAEEYYKQIKGSGQVDSKTLDRMANVVDAGRLRGESQRQTDKILDKDLKQDEALAQARSIEDPKVRDEVVKRVKNRYAEAKTISDNQKRELFEATALEVEEKKTRDHIPPEKWAALTDSQRKAIDARITQLNKGIEPQTDLQNYYNLRTMATTDGTREEFARLNLMEHRSKLNKTDFEKLSRLQEDIRTRRPSAELDGLRSDQRVVDDTLAQVGIEKKKGKKINPRYAQFNRKIDEEVERWKKANNKKTIPNSELQAIVDGLLVEGTVEGTGFFGFFEDKKRIFELEGEERIHIDVSDVPPSERKKIQRALERRNIPVTDDKVVEMYRVKLSARNTDG